MGKSTGCHTLSTLGQPHCGLDGYPGDCLPGEGMLCSTRACLLLGNDYHVNQMSYDFRRLRLAGLSSGCPNQPTTTPSLLKVSRIAYL